MIKLHLGCGGRYLEGYVNIDLPPTRHPMGTTSCSPDIEADVTSICYPAGTVDEIRSHHLFEHFHRPVALAMLCRWRDWLTPDGLLRIETPDAWASFRLMMSPFHSFDAKQQVMRHLFGSHEADWAIHADGWYKEKFHVTLTGLGFKQIRFERNRWGVLRSIEVYARKSSESFSRERYELEVRRLLAHSTVRVTEKEPQGTELRMLEEWMNIWRKSYDAAAESQESST